MSNNDILMSKPTLIRHTDGVYTVGGQGNSVVADLGDRLLLVDAGPGGPLTDTMIAEVRAVLEQPLAYIVYSHGHMGYNNGVRQWLDDAAARGHASPELVAHAKVADRYRRYRETAGLQSYTNTRQFRTDYPAQPPAHWFQMPTLTYERSLVLHGSRRHVELMHAPSETDDGTAMWIPDARTLYGANAFIKTCPNVGSPYRIYRDPIRWAQTLDRFAALAPAVLIPEFGKPLTEAADIDEALTVPARALRYLREQVVARMNTGMHVDDIIHDVPLPDALFGSRYMKPAYGCAEYIMRDIWRSENGWWNRNASDLHPAAPVQRAAAVRRALGDPRPILARARELQANAQVQLALHVIDLLAGDGADTSDPATQAARRLKAELCEARAKTVTSVVSRHLYLSTADELLGRSIGSVERERGESGYAWQ
ncbi:alkyl sulfatase dimerization domain-containing protein [Cupriavidus oxalaticus]|uniref:Alkyl sulfatase n=1 Tax=Cupriavidus oxalaticus TaxID=96344 RepID=A0A375FRZ6_9BURK|nr:alkyl sulfatase dimerization domain-containing protein [Cupriavidus oxalaticus]QRQ85844.1 MBL fold metallo-hydrolase [Cupriavidus oxalaticus]QRQ95830.1 MBL fold metallo-hydrolase [Cupriavidus oxalaticus]WQD84507.1 alkyl sulfatase dimerization domain-containing protein [Cupriavidus oxalaticus]SPC06575.1 Alkyl sulfatase [Cupriavidus oxalaticus]SPC12444.1 Alkyl sulfatase [Cupriavidus oxalaticus]